ncbi:MAG: hypothetical protein U0325_12675 [Polyangiales bacterium]
MNNVVGLSRRALLGLLVLSACSATVSPNGQPALSVEASVSSANLAQDCPSSGSSGAGLAARCAPADGGAADSVCGSLCRQSSMQIQVRATGEGIAQVTVARVRLLDARTGAFLQDLTARAPQVWVDPNGYRSWDGNITAGQTLRTSHAISAPNWYAFARPADLYSRTYRIEVVLRVDGVERTIVSAELMREPEVVT